MAQLFRQPVNTEDSPDDQWTPPSYAKPAEEEWSPPSYAKPVETKKEEKPSIFTRMKAYHPSNEGILDSISKAAGDFAEKHPTITNVARRMLLGPNKEEVGGREVTGPGLMKVPGTDKLTESIRNKGINTGNYWGGFFGSLASDAVDMLGTGFDPRTAGLGPYSPGEPSIPSVRRPPVSKEIPYRATEELPKPETIKSNKLTNLQEYMKKNPDAKMADVMQFVKSVESAQAPPEIIKIGEKPLPTRSPNLDPARFDIGTESPKSTGKSAEDLSYDIAREKFNMGRPLPEGEAPKGDFVNPFEKPKTKPTAEFAYDWPDVGKQYHVNDPDNLTGGFHKSTVGEERLKELGIEIPEAKSKWKPPEYVKPSEELPQAARTKSGKIAIGADVKSLGKVLGTSLYKGDIAPIATKELLQNSIDAVRHLGSEGKIDVVFDRPKNAIRVSDNGKGLTRKELETVFTDLGSSGKRSDESAAGGFGLAKAAPLLGGEKVEVSSIAKAADGTLYEHSFEGTPEQLLKGVDIKSRVMPEGTQTGTHVKVYVPKDSDFYGSENFVKNLSRHSPNVEAQIRMGHDFVGTRPENVLNTIEKGTRKPIATIENPAATTEISEPSTSDRKTRSLIRMHLSNNGMYQGSHSFYLNEEAPNIPADIVVNIRPKVPEGHGDYPFTANREELRGTVETQVKKYIEDNIVKPGLGKRLDELKRLYNSMGEITVGKGQFPNTFGRKIAIYDPKGQLTQSELSSITSNPAFHTLANNLGSIMDEAMKTAGTDLWRDRLEKFGFIFDDRLHGIHIPNPGSGKSAILVNPFVAIEKMSPDEASANILHTILHEMAHVEPIGAGHNESFTIRLGEIYGKFGARRSVEAQDQILNSIANKGTGIYNPEIQEILSTYKESRGREGTTEDLLSGTGIKSKTPGGGEGNIPSSNKPDGEGTSSAVSKLLDALKEAKGLTSEQEAINRTERARRFAAFSSVKQEGAAGAAKSLGKLRGEFDKVNPGERLELNQKETDSLFTAVKQANITPGEKARGYTALFKLMNGEAVPVRSELRILDDVFGNGFADQIIEMHGGLGAIPLKVSKLANTWKSLQNSISLAAPLRHGIGLAYRKEFGPAFADMFKFFANKEYYETAMKAIEDRPNYMLGREVGLFTAKPGSLLNSEEEFLNSYVGSIPVARDVVGASQRGYVGFLNKLRSDTFDSMVKQMEGLGFKSHEIVDGQIVPAKETEAIAKYINTATGRGDLGRLNKMTNELNLVFWSPRMIASRFQMFNPKLYTNLPKGMRLEGLKSLLGIAALGTTIDTLAAYGGAKVSTNILSTDFGKSRFGTHLIDPWGGFQQFVVGAARFLAGKTDSSQPTTRLDIAGRFLANKESPAANLAHTILTSKPTKGGQPGDITTEYGQKTNIQSQIGKQFVPIFIQDLYDLATSDPDWSENIGLTTALTGASLVGMSQDYPEKKTGGLKFRKPGAMKLK